MSEPQTNGLTGATDLTRAALQTIRPLDDMERIAAAEAAKEVVKVKLGDAPDRAAYADTAVSRYPAWVTRGVGVLMVVVFIAAALPSLFRLYTAGRDYFTTGNIAQTTLTGSTPTDSTLTGAPVVSAAEADTVKRGINDGVQGAIVGVSTFLLAEFLIVLSTIAARVYFTGRARAAFVIPIMLGLAVAFVGNYVVARPHDVFSWLETIVPPIAVLFMALVGERLILDAVESMHAGEVAYQTASAAHRAHLLDLTTHAAYRNAYATALRKALIEANVKGVGATARRDLMATFTPPVWRALVIRELAADNWFEAAGEDTAQPTSTPASAPVSHSEADTAQPSRRARANRPASGDTITPAVNEFEAAATAEDTPAFLALGGMTPTAPTNGNGKH